MVDGSIKIDALRFHFYTLIVGHRPASFETMDRGEESSDDQAGTSWSSLTCGERSCIASEDLVSSSRYPGSRPRERGVHPNHRPLPLAARSLSSTHFKYRPSHSCTSRHQTIRFCGLRIQRPSSGNQTKRLGTPRRCRHVNIPRPCASGTRKSCAPWMTKVGVRKSRANVLGER